MNGSFSLSLFFNAYKDLRHHLLFPFKEYNAMFDLYHEASLSPEMECAFRRPAINGPKRQHMFKRNSEGRFLEEQLEGL